MKTSFLLLFGVLLELLLAVQSTKLVAFSIENGQNDVTRRQAESARKNDIDLGFIGTGGILTKGDEITTMKDYVESLKDEKEKIIIFVESGSLFQNSSEEIIRRFKSMEAKIIISAINECRPDPSLNASYPEVGKNEKGFVNAEGIIGYAEVLLEAMSVPELQMIKDRQYYFSKLFTNSELREKFSIKLDTKSEIFQNLEESSDEVKVEHSGEREGFLQNVLTQSLPAVIQPGEKRIELESLSNYLGQAWDPVVGCQHCIVDKIYLSEKNKSEYPSLTVAVFIDQPTPFLEEFFIKTLNLSYPKSRISLVISNMVPSQEKVVQGFLDTHKEQYSSVKFIDASTNSSSAERKTNIMTDAKASTEYIFMLEASVHLGTEDTIESLMAYNKSIMAPLVSRRGLLWSNFWGDLAADGYYRRSFDYLDIVNGEKRGLWKVPHINNVYLMKTEILYVVPLPFKQISPYQASEIDMLFSRNMRDAAVTMHIANEVRYGYMVNVDSTTTEHLHNDLWEIFSNPEDWKEKYIHPEYEKIAHKDFLLANFTQPCTDVFWWPFLSETFTKHMIEEMEFFGQWSNGSNKDQRLEGGYENVPTRDIHMRQVNWEEHWMHVLKTYVYPIQIKLYEGYYDEPRARMNFVVRYKPTEQDRLQPHHDASSYTLNIALNKPGVDYEGGGAKFNRYNCAVIDSRVGWVIMSPGRITHLHEGLPTTKGTRYIFITFINP